MEIKLASIREYLIKEQGYTEDEIDNIPLEEQIDLYEMYHED